MTVSEKSVIFDVICTDADTGAIFVVELQYAEQKTDKDIDKMDYTL